MMKDHKDYTFEEPLQAEALNFDSQEPQQQAPFIPDEIPPVEEGMAEVHMKDLQKKSMKTANTRKENPPEWYGQKKKKIIKDFFNLFGIVAACVVVVLLILHRIGVRFSYTAELGEGRPDASVFFTDDTGDARYKWGKEVSLTEEGRYLQVIESSRLYHLVLLVVKDTTPPTARDAGAVITSQESILP